MGFACFCQINFRVGVQVENNDYSTMLSCCRLLSSSLSPRMYWKTSEFRYLTAEWIMRRRKGNTHIGKEAQKKAIMAISGNFSSIPDHEDHKSFSLD